MSTRVWCTLETFLKLPKIARDETTILRIDESGECTMKQLIEILPSLEKLKEFSLYTCVETGKGEFPDKTNEMINLMIDNLPDQLECLILYISMEGADMTKFYRLKKLNYLVIDDRNIKCLGEYMAWLYLNPRRLYLSVSTNSIEGTVLSTRFFTQIFNTKGICMSVVRDDSAEWYDNILGVEGLTTEIPPAKGKSGEGKSGEELSIEDVDDYCRKILDEGSKRRVRVKTAFLHCTNKNKKLKKIVRYFIHSICKRIKTE